MLKMMAVGAKFDSGAVLPCIKSLHTMKFTGRGVGRNPANPYLKHAYVEAFPEGLDEPLLIDKRTEFLRETPKKIVNRVTSPDIPFPYSMNPYQGCEHGCVYCYARNTHQYWGMSAGLDFERRIIIKENAALLLRQTLDKPSWKPQTIMLSGNTDCYQPVERKLGLTRNLIEVMVEYQHPVGIITKNSLVLRDLDLIQELAKKNLVRVAISITSMDEELRRHMEPRTSTTRQRLKAIEQLAKAGVPVTVMAAPIAPGLNSHEIVPILRAASEAGATGAGYTIMRLNGPVATLFKDWIEDVYPDRAEKVLHQIAEIHGGKLGDSRFGTRMRGQGEYALAIKELFRIAKTRFFGRESKLKPLNLTAFQRPVRVGGQMSLF